MYNVLINNILILMILYLTLIILFKYNTIKIKENFNDFKYEFVIGAMFKNESHILKEWLDHYKFHGVDHIYLINDFSTDNPEEILQTYIDEGFVTLFNNIERDEILKQTELYELYFRDILQHSEWMAIIDLDEFIYTSDNINIKDSIKKYSDADALFLIWRMFGSSGHIEQPESVVQGFTKRKLDDGENGKTIFKTKSLIKFDPHSPDVGNTKILYLDDIHINHYAIQSWSFFETIKMSRGDSYYSHNVRDRNYFDSYDYNEVEDNVLALQNIEI